ncbi:MAG TPA: hypothetical protein VNO32_44770, partial [Candidatus Acidoferrum sp.]|nr:hypothetical protein [Candidatus Acidoferrum sp.]
ATAVRHDINTTAKQSNILFFIFNDLLERTSVCLLWNSPKVSWAEIAQTWMQAFHVCASEGPTCVRMALFVAPNSAQGQGD